MFISQKNNHIEQRNPEKHHIANRFYFVKFKKKKK